MQLRRHAGVQQPAALDDLVDQTAQIERLGRAHVLALHLGQQHQVVDQRAHPRAFDRDRREDPARALVAGVGFAPQQVDVAEHDRQRRAQLVPGVGDELAHLRLRLRAFGKGAGDLRRRRVVGQRDRVELALPGDGDRLRREVARGEALQRVGDLDQRAQHLGGDVAAREPGQHAREGADQQDAGEQPQRDPLRRVGIRQDAHVAVAELDPLEVRTERRPEREPDAASFEPDRARIDVGDAAVDDDRRGRPVGARPDEAARQGERGRGRPRRRLAHEQRAR